MKKIEYSENVFLIVPNCLDFSYYNFLRKYVFRF